MKKWLFIVLITPMVLFITFLILDKLFPLDMDRLNKPKSRVVYDRFGKIIHISLSRDGFIRVPIQGEISENIKEALISYEDKFFYYHFGVNPISIFRALIFNLTNKNRKIGASTITMQVARLMHHRERTFSNKLKESFEALQLEYHFSKDEILRFYLNNTPYGGNIEGIEGASILYFGLPSKSLSLAQTAYLVSIPKNPNQNRPENLDLEKVDSLKKKVLNAIKENNKALKNPLAFDEVIKPKRRKLPNFIPTLARRFPKKIIKSSINLSMQKELRKILKKALKKVEKLNIYNASGLIIDNKNRNILAYVGSANFEQNNHSNKIDGIKALISAGSTLKPFIYAKAFELGILTPNRVVFDIPYSLGDFIPMNYEGRFFGELRAKEALYLSRNIPALQLNRVLENNSLYEILKIAKVSSLKKEKWYYGDSIALGGSNITLMEIAKLYFSLANGGILENISFKLNGGGQDKIKIFSKEASWLTLNILTETPRDRFDSNWEFIKSKSRIAFKTGTSAHAHDMLSIGVTPKFTVAIWFGNFSRKFGVGSFDRKKSGLKVAVPAMMEMFDSLKPKNWFKKPQKVLMKEICEDAIIIGECKQIENDLVIKGVNLVRPCRYFSPQILIKLINDGKIPKFSALKDHNCFDTWRRYEPLIEGLSDGKTYIKNRVFPKSMKLTALKCYSFDDNQTIFWFIDNNQTLTSKSGEKIFHYLPPGKHTVKCIDAQSREKRVEIKLREL